MPEKAKECPASFTRLQNLVKVEATISEKKRLAYWENSLFFPVRSPAFVLRSGKLWSSSLTFLRISPYEEVRRKVREG
jgi:hypothetical protein